MNHINMIINKTKLYLYKIKGLLYNTFDLHPCLVSKILKQVIYSKMFYAAPC